MLRDESQRHDGPPLDGPSRRDARFVELLTSHQRDLYAYAFALVAGDAAVADIVQDANVDLWANRESFDPDRPFLPWAFRFVHHRVLAFRRTRGRSRLVYSDAYLETLASALANEPLGADARLTALASCLERLREDQQRLVRERYVQGGSVKGIATRMGATADQVSARLYRLRRVLGDCVNRRLAREWAP